MHHVAPPRRYGRCELAAKEEREGAGIGTERTLGSTRKVAPADQAGGEGKGEGSTIVVHRGGTLKGAGWQMRRRTRNAQEKRLQAMRVYITDYDELQDELADMAQNSLAEGKVCSPGPHTWRIPTPCAFPSRCTACPMHHVWRRYSRSAPSVTVCYCLLLVWYSLLLCGAGTLDPRLHAAHVDHQRRPPHRVPARPRTWCTPTPCTFHAVHR